MFSRIGAFLFLAVVALTGCGGGGGGSDTFNPAALDIELYADSKSLPVNSVNEPPSSGGPYTSSITIRAKRTDGSLATGADISLSITKGQASGALYYLDDDHEDDEGNPQAFKSVAETDTTGVTTFLFHASDTPGEVVLSATVSDPESGETFNDGITLQVVQGTSDGVPSDIQFTVPSDPLYVQGIGEQDQKQITVWLGDAGGQPVPDPDNRNLRVSLKADTVNGGEYLSGGSSGSSIDIATTNGVGVFTLHSGTVAGQVTIEVTADAADNDVTNGISDPVTDEVTVSISDGKVYSLTFTGPFVDAILTNQEEFDDGTTVQNGVYSRVLSVVANDRFGNPVPAGTEIQFGLIDSPISGYPAGGGGSFDISGSQGNPSEDGTSFTVPTSETFNNARLNDTLVLDGLNDGNSSVDNRDHTGAWVISTITDNQHLRVTENFNANDGTGSIVDTGSTVPWYIGRAQYGLIMSPAYTDSDGTATTKLIYPVTRLNQTAIIYARASDRSAAGVLTGNSVYLGVKSTDDSVMTLTTSHETLDANSTTSVTMCLKDANLAPVPGETIDYAVSGAGGATVTVNGGSAVITGSDGCATFDITSSGQTAGSEAITITFGAGLVDTPATITINGPGDGNLFCTLTENSSTEYEVGMTLLTDDGVPIQDTFLTHEHDASSDVTDDNSDGDPSLTSVTYSPSDQKTDSNGEVTATVTVVAGDAGTDSLTVTFRTAEGSATCDAVIVF